MYWSLYPHAMVSVLVVCAWDVFGAFLCFVFSVQRRCSVQSRMMMRLQILLLYVAADAMARSYLLQVESSRERVCEWWRRCNFPFFRILVSRILVLLLRTSMYLCFYNNVVSVSKRWVLSLELWVYANRNTNFTFLFVGERFRWLDASAAYSVWRHMLCHFFFLDSGFFCLKTTRTCVFCNVMVASVQSLDDTDWYLITILIWRLVCAINPY